MNKIRKINYNVSLLLILTMTLNLLISLTSVNVYGKENYQVIDNLEIVNKSDEYYPGETINIKGEWSIPDDSTERQYKSGDTFSMTIPDGLNAKFSSITLGELAVGKVVGDKLEFTFTDKVEGLTGRKGGFQLRFEVETPDEDGKKEIDLESKDENGNILLYDKIIVNKPEQGDIEGSYESFGKGKMSQTVDGLKWYIRINHDGSIKGDTIKFEDQLGQNHILKEDTIEIREHISETEEEDITESLNVVVNSDKKSFYVSDLNLSGGFKGYKYYTIYYETQYTGNEIDGVVNLKNTGKIVTKEQGVLYPDYSDEDGAVEGDFDLGIAGWGVGYNPLKFKLKKIDSITKEPLDGVKFRLSHKIDDSFKPIEFTTDENGEYEHNGYINNGLYVLEELDAPEGYKKMEAKDIRVLYNPNEGSDQVFKFEVENEPEPINIAVNKIWRNYDGEEISSQKNIVISLYANNDKIRQKVLVKGESDFEFRNLPKKDLNGEEIEYTILEEEIEGYESTITGNYKEGFIVTNKEVKVEPGNTKPLLPTTGTQGTIVFTMLGIMVIIAGVSTWFIEIKRKNRIK